MNNARDVKLSDDDIESSRRLNKALNAAHEKAKRWQVIISNVKGVQHIFGPFETHETADFWGSQNTDGKHSIRVMYDVRIVDEEMNKFFDAEKDRRRYEAAMREGRA